MDRRIRLGGLLLLLVAAAGCPSPPPPLVDGGGTDPRDAPTDVRMGACSGDDECSDGMYCNGRERCEPTSGTADLRGCVAPRGRPCLDVQVCEEATDTCVTDCGVDRDADDDGIDAEICGGTDCDDADALRFPGNAEVCGDTAHDEDCNAATFGARDLDRDGAFDARCCNVDSAGARFCGDDCDDTRRSVRPLGTEVCDGLDNDCSGMVDEGVTTLAYLDADGDLHGHRTATTMSCPGAAGVSYVHDDCDDTRRDVHGSQVEICDGVDNDCNSVIDDHARPVTWYRDADGDGFGSAAGGTMVSCTPITGFSLLPTDCDDTNRSRSPVAAEICDGLDDDCNGQADFTVGVNDREDDDGDGHADRACGGDDCDDGAWSTYPGAPEICDHRDSDCDDLSDLGAMPPMGAMADSTEEVDWYPDVDLDLYGADVGAIRSCVPVPARVVRGGDCADTDGMTHPGALDVCDGVDDDCDGGIDEDATDRAYYADTDGDGNGAGAVTLACVRPPGFTDLPGDCAPADASRGPSVIEICDGADQDCDAMIDELLFRDADGDGHGDPSTPSGATCAPSDVGLDDDCDDSDPLVGAEGTCVELCNGIDDDRDGMADEGAEASCPNAANTIWTCPMGACVFGGCRGGLTGDCNGLSSDGCEFDVATDGAHCGACTTACDVGEACSAGICDDPIVEIDCGDGSTMARRRSGSVVYWGLGGAYVAGPDTSDYLPRVSYVALASEIELRMGRGCAMIAGERLCWGAALHPAYFGSTILGDGVIADVILPTALAAGPFVDVALGHSYSCGVRPGGQVLCWGGPVGPGTGIRALGDGLATGTTTPVTVLGLMDASAVEAGNRHTCAIRSNGHVVCWGENESRLGIGTAGARDSPLEEVELVSGLPLTNVVELAISTGNAVWGGGHTCARLGAPDRGVMCWGENGYAATGGNRGALGIDDGVTNVTIPYAVSVVSGLGSTTPLTGAVRIAAGFIYTCAELASGSLVCWGNNDSGQLGLGTTTYSAAPVPVPIPAFTDWCVGHDHACALLTDGSVRCWGSNAYGQCGQDGVSTVLSPTEVVPLRRGPPP